MKKKVNELTVTRDNVQSMHDKAKKTYEELILECKNDPCNPDLRDSMYRWCGIVLAYEQLLKADTKERQKKSELEDKDEKE